MCRDDMFKCFISYKPEMTYKMLHECYNGTFSWITLEKKKLKFFFKQKFMGTSLNGKIQCVIKKIWKEHI